MVKAAAILFGIAAARRARRRQADYRFRGAREQSDLKAVSIEGLVKGAKVFG